MPQEHWFTIRKMADGSFYNFNSLYPAPEVGTCATSSIQISLMTRLQGICFLPHFPDKFLQGNSFILLSDASHHAQAAWSLWQPKFIPTPLNLMPIILMSTYVEVLDHADFMS